MSEDDVRANIEAAEARRPPRRKPVANGADPLPALPLSFAASWYGVEIPPREWLVANIVPMRTVTLVTGHGGEGKSTLIMQLQAAVGAPDGRWLDRDCMHVPSVGVFCEDEERELQRRLGAICNRMDIDMASLVDTAMISLAGNDEQLLAVPSEDGRLVPTPLFESLRAACIDLGARLVIVDGAADVYGGNENDRGQVRTFLGMLRRLAIDLNGSVILIAHPSRQGLRDDSGTSGSTHWHNAARSLLYITRPAPEDGEEYDPDLREMRHLKNQYGPKADPITMKWNDGAMVVQHGSTGVVAAIEDSLADKKFLDALDQVIGSGRYATESKNSPAYAPKLLRTVMDSPPSVRAMERAMRRLFKSGDIVVAQVMRPNRHLGPGIVRRRPGQETPAGPLFDPPAP